jgi:hypothetical protein
LSFYIWRGLIASLFTVMFAFYVTNRIRRKMPIKL